MMQMRSGRLFGALIILSVFFIAACQTFELYGNLSESEANEMLGLLSQNGINAQKEKVVEQNVASFKLKVAKSDLVGAIKLVNDNGLPRRKSPGTEKLVGGDRSMIPTPSEDKARILLGKRDDIVNALRSIPEIVEANVVLNVPEKDTFAPPEVQEKQRPTASVVLRVRPNPAVTDVITEAKIQQAVANGVEGMNPRDVSVMISYVMVANEVQPNMEVKNISAQDVTSDPKSAKQNQIAKQEFSDSANLSQDMIGLKLDDVSKIRLKVYILVFFLILMVLAVALIISIVQGSRMRRQISQLGGSGGNGRPALEGHLMDEEQEEMAARDEERV